MNQFSSNLKPHEDTSIGGEESDLDDTLRMKEQLLENGTTDNEKS